MAKYKGPVVFVEGVHYPATGEEGAADLTKPLRFEDGGYRDAEPDEALHNDANPSTDLELEVGGES